jgi:ParB family transcriptional regulator, chromosome partitioning protein
MDSLGRGLDSLIPNRPSEDNPVVSPMESKQERQKADEVEEAASQAQAVQARSYNDHFLPRKDDAIFWIELEKIEPNPFQPRREFAEDALQELASSIREHGMLQPVLVTKREFESPSGLEVRYQLIAGERRFRAAKIAGLSQIPAIIRRGIPDDRIRLELALIENVQREDLNAIEKARAYKRLIDEFHMVQREVAERVGKSREAIINTMRLLAMPQEVQDAIVTGKVTEGHARAMLIAGDEAKQMEVFRAVVQDRLNVREAEAKARQVGGKMLQPRRRASMDPEAREWQAQLQEHFGAKIQLQRMGERGRIVMEFFSDEELRGILDKLIREA